MTTPAEAPSDAQLIERTRDGDMNAYDELYRRHYDDASRVARIVTNNSDEAQDIVAEAFTRVLTRLREGGGPDTELTPYLRTVVRRLAVDRHRTAQKGGQTADPAVLELLPRTDDPMARATDRQLVRQAFETLPDRWQQVLWHTEIEGRSPASIAATLSSTPNAVAALAYRAREGLRQAYLAVNLSSDVRAECRPFAPKVAAYVRGTLSAQHTRAVTTHLGECEYCRERRDELLLLVSDLRGTLWPALLLPASGGAAAAAAAAVVGGGAATTAVLAAPIAGGAATGGTASAGAGAAAAGAAAGAAAAGSGPAGTAASGAASAAASASGAGASGAGTAGAGASSGSGSIISTLSPGRLARLGSKTLAGAAGVAAAGIIAAGAYLMLSGNPDDPVDQASSPGTSAPGNGSSGDPTSPGTSDPGSTPGDPTTDPDDPTSTPSESDDATTDPTTEGATPDSETPGGGAPVGNTPDSSPSDTPDSTDSPDSPDSPDPTNTPDDDPSDEPDDDPSTPPEDSDDSSAPSFRSSPDNVTARAGEPTTLTVDVAGSPAPTLVWQTRAPSGGSSVAAASTATSTAAGDRIAQASGGGWRDVGSDSTSLTIRPEAGDDGRQYRVVAKNDQGTETTSPAVLTVHYAPTVSSNPSGATVIEGEGATFSASATGNPAPDEVTWERRKSGGSWQRAGGGDVNGGSSSISVSGERDLDGYEYRAVFSNGVGKATSSAAGLNVRWAPSVVSGPQSGSGFVGETVSLAARAEAGNPRDTAFEWQVNTGSGWQTVASGNGTEANRNVKLQNKDNDSRYRVVFQNDVGTSVTGEAKVTVNPSGTLAVSAGGDERCVTPSDASSSGTPLTLSECDSDPPTTTASWQFHADDTIRWGTSGWCLTVVLDSDSFYPRAILRECHDVDQGRLWNYDIEALKTGDTISSGRIHGADLWCLDVEGAQSEGRLIAYPHCHGESNQIFTLR